MSFSGKPKPPLPNATPPRSENAKTGLPNYPNYPQFDGRPPAQKLPQPPGSNPKRSATARKPATHGRMIGLVRTESNLKELPIDRAVTMSTIAHVVGPFAAWLIVTLIFLLVLWLANIDLWKMLFPPQPDKKPDMVFALVQDTQAQKPKNAKMRGQFNQQAGGENDPNKPLAPPERPAPQAKAAKQPAKPEVKKTPPPQPQSKPQPQQKPTPPQPKPQPKQPEAKKPPMPQPSFKPTIPMPSVSRQQQAPKAMNTPTGPVTSASRPTPASNGTPAPVQIASQGAMAMASPNSKGATSGNAQGGKNPRAGVDVEADIDYGPFMADLERRIKRNWVPPRDSRSKRVQVKFWVQRDGRLAKVMVQKSSGDSLADSAATRAVEVSAPFKAIPPQVKEDVLEIEFTFDYNVFNSAKAN